MTIVFIEANFSGAHALARCVDFGMEAVLVTSSYERLLQILPRGSNELLRRASRVVEVENSLDVHQVVRAMSLAGVEANAVLTFSQPYLVVAAELARELGLPHANIEAVKVARHKFEMRKRLAKAGLEEVRSEVAETRAEIGKLASTIGFPCVLKPNVGQASIGVHICRTALELNQALEAIEKANTTMSISSSYLVERFLEGPLFSVETLTESRGNHHIWGIADRTIIDGATEVSSSFPVYPHRYQEIISHVCKALDAIGYDLGAAHTEVILTDEGPRIVEINTRVGGSGHLQMLELAMNAPLSLDIIGCHLGRSSHKRRTPQNGACWYAFVPRASGRLNALPVAAEILVERNIEEVWYYRSEGDNFSYSKSNFDWVLEVLSSGKTASEARGSAEKAVAQIEAKTIIGNDETKGTA